MARALRTVVAGGVQRLRVEEDRRACRALRDDLLLGSELARRDLSPTLLPRHFVRHLMTPADERGRPVLARHVVQTQDDHYRIRQSELLERRVAVETPVADAVA